MKGTILYRSFLKEQDNILFSMKLLLLKIQRKRLSENK